MRHEIFLSDLNACCSRLLKHASLLSNWNDAALQPSLHRGRVLVAQKTCGGVHPAQLGVDHMLGLGKGLMRHERIYTLKTYTRQTWKAYTRRAILAP